jgi:hypothetical protein
MFMPVVRDWALRIKDSPSRYLIPLSYASILGGMVSMVLTKSRMGLTAICGGCFMILLSYAIAAYAHYIILPIGIVLTIVSALWGYLTIVKAWRQR